MISTQLKHFFDKIGGPKAINFTAWVVLSPVAIIGSVFSFDEALIGRSFEVISISTILSYLTSGLIFLLAYKTYLKPKREKSRPLAALLTFFISGALTGLSLSALSGWFGIESDPDYLGRAVTRGWFGLFWSSIVVLFVDSRHRYQQAAELLNNQILENQRLISERSEIVNSVRLELVELVRVTLAKIIENPSPKLLSRLADEVIRPLAREIQNKGVSFRPPTAYSGNKVRLGPVVVGSLSAPSTSILIPLSAGTSAIVSTLATLGLGAVTNLVLFTLAFFITTKVAQRAKLRSPLALLPLWVTGFALMLSATAFIWSESEFVIRTMVLNSGTWLLAMILNFQTTLEASRTESLGKLSFELEESAWHRKRLQQEVWVESRRLAKFVHGDIQGRIRAAAMTASELSPLELEKLKLACLQALESRPDGVKLDYFLEQSSEVWADVLAIQTVFSASAIEELSQDSFATEAVIETLREAMVNAVRHGQATLANISISIVHNSATKFVAVEVENNGGPVPEAYEPGLGTELLDEVTTSWTLENSEMGVLLRADIPLSAQTR